MDRHDGSVTFFAPPRAFLRSAVCIKRCSSYPCTQTAFSRLIRPDQARRPQVPTLRLSGCQLPRADLENGLPCLARKTSDPVFSTIIQSSNILTKRGRKKPFESANYDSEILKSNIVKPNIGLRFYKVGLCSNEVGLLIEQHRTLFSPKSNFDLCLLYIAHYQYDIKLSKIALFLPAPLIFKNEKADCPPENRLSKKN
jgi:hypothetical protein